MFSLTAYDKLNIVLTESVPYCSRNEFRDVINLTCSVTFRGDGNPVIKWIQIIGKEEKEITVGIENTKRAGPLFTHTSSLMLPVHESEINQFQFYRYIAQFCIPDSAAKATVTVDRSCVFSQLIHIG